MDENFYPDYTGNEILPVVFNDAQVVDILQSVPAPVYSNESDSPLYFPSGDPSFSANSNIAGNMSGNGSFNFGAVLNGVNAGITGVNAVYATVERARLLRDQAAIARAQRVGNTAITTAAINRDVAAGVTGVPLTRRIGFNGEATLPENLATRKFITYLGLAGAIYFVAKKVIK
jgi:hypothetical protein